MSDTSESGAEALNEALATRDGAFEDPRDIEDNIGEPVEMADIDPALAHLVDFSRATENVTVDALGSVGDDEYDDETEEPA